MVTTAARMFQRRRTAAQWASENPVLGAGEIGFETDTGLAKIGDGTTAYNSLLAIGVKSNHDALYASWNDVEHNGTEQSESGADTGLPGIDFDDTATRRVKWRWPIPTGWDGVAVRWGSSNRAAGTGNIKWQFAYKLIYLGEGDVTGAMTATITIPALASGGQFDWTYNLPTETASITTANGGLGDKPAMLCVLSRLGTDGTDTLNGGTVRFHEATATRVEL